MTTHSDLTLHINNDTKAVSGVVNQFPDNSRDHAFTRVQIKADDLEINFLVREQRREEFGLLLMNLGEWLYHGGEGEVTSMQTPEAEEVNES